MLSSKESYNYVKWIAIVILIGIVFGWIRYWIGYYILLQGIAVGLIIPWVIHKTGSNGQKVLYDHTFKIAVLLFFTFMIGQAIGFGLAQPVFDPIGWLSRVWQGDTTESVFGIYSTGGVAHHTFSEGMSGGFWSILSFIDLAFMFFFMLIGLPPKTKKNRS